MKTIVIDDGTSGTGYLKVSVTAGIESIIIEMSPGDFNSETALPVIFDESPVMMKQFSPAKRWDMKAFFQLPLWFCRWLCDSIKIECINILNAHRKRQLRPRRAYNNGIRYALCDTRVI